jgi:proteasome lid subunit RPN8/RPN11
MLITPDTKEILMLTQMTSIDGKRTFFLGYVDSQLKMACEAEDRGDNIAAIFHLHLALGDY